MTGWEIDPGKWEITQGTRGNADSDPVQNSTTRTEDFERSRSLETYVRAAYDHSSGTEAGKQRGALIGPGPVSWASMADDIKVEGKPHEGHGA